MTGRRIPVALAFTMTWLRTSRFSPRRSVRRRPRPTQDAKRGPPGAPAAEKSAVLKTEAATTRERPFPRPRDWSPPGPSAGGIRASQSIPGASRRSTPSGSAASATCSTPTERSRSFD